MRTLTAIAIVTAAAFSTVAQAEPTNVPQTDAAVHIKGASPRVHMSEREFDSNFSGRYQLENGKKLTVSNVNMRYFAQIDGKDAKKIVAIGPKTFASIDGEMLLTFDAERNGVVNDVVVAQ